VVVRCVGEWSKLSRVSATHEKRQNGLSSVQRVSVKDGQN
jgi:hypothetical protein